MTNDKDNVINTVVKNDLCIGCGMCTYKNEDKLEMIWNNEGFLVPHLLDNTFDLKNDLDVCPFNPNPEKEVRTENEIANLFLKDAPNRHSKIGRFNNLYVGYAQEFREKSSSGGIASFVFTSLLEKNQVDHIISVKGSANNHFEYSVSSSVEQLMETTKTKYYPVTLATILPEINKLSGTVAVSGVACFIKSIRLAQHYHPELKMKIKFLVGIICGGIKSSFFAEYLASKAGVKQDDFEKPKFRMKDYQKPANDYSFGCTTISTGEEKQIKMKAVGEMWGTGLFKANACDFCDDVTTELADISVGDAWLQPYVKDGRGTSVVVTRSIQANKIIQDAVHEKKVQLEILPLENFLESQRGSFNHRHDGMPFRIKQAKKKSRLVPPKRYQHESRNILNSFKLVQYFRRITRARSLYYWQIKADAKFFDAKMQKYLQKLRMATRINRYAKLIISKLNW